MARGFGVLLMVLSQGGTRVRDVLLADSVSGDDEDGRAFLFLYRSGKVPGN